MKKLLDRLLRLAKNDAKTKEEIKITSNLLKKFLTHYMAHKVPEELRREQFFDTDTTIASGMFRNPKRTAWGEFLLYHVLNVNKHNEIEQTLETLKKREKGEEETTGHWTSTSTPETARSEETTGSSIPTETETEKR